MRLLAFFEACACKHKETVGSNEGEENEDCECEMEPNPKKIVPKGNAVSDSDGSNGWDWNDPIHGPNQQNAVVSKTP